MKVEVVLAWPARVEACVLQLHEGTTVAEAMQASGIDLSPVTGQAIHGIRVAPEAVLQDGDRLELLRPLQLDPREARRRRAADQAPRRP